MLHALSAPQKVALGCYVICQLLFFGMGFTYLFRTEFMPYHAEALGQTWRDLSPALQILLLALMKATGGGLLASGIAHATLTFIPFRRGERWALFAVPAVGLVVSGSALWATLTVLTGTPASPPWQAALVGVVLSCLGFILSMLPAKKDA